MEKREKMRRDLLADTGGDMSAEREEMLQKRAYAQVLKEQAAEGKIEDDIDKITTYPSACVALATIRNSATLYCFSSLVPVAPLPYRERVHRLELN